MLIQPRSEEDHKNIIEQGFTLVELLIVVVILGILAGIVVFAVGNLGGSAQTNACATEKSTIETAVEAYRANTNSPTVDPTEAQLVTANLLKTQSSNYDISYASHVATVAPQAGGNC